MLIKITKSCKGSANGITVTEYEPSEEYIEVDDDLARVFVDQMNTAEYPRGIKAIETVKNTVDGGTAVAVTKLQPLANMEWASNAEIKELRVFADMYDIKNRSLDGLRDELLEANLLVEDGGYKGE